MRIDRSLAIAALLTMALVTAARAEGDVAAGKELAQQWCTRCHNIEPGGPWQLHPPSFASVAVFRAPEHIRTRILFPPVHTSMPELGAMLSLKSVDDLVAYIVSLEKQ